MFLLLVGGDGMILVMCMVKTIIDTGANRSEVLLYSNRTAKVIAYKDVFDQARTRIGMNTVYAVTDDKTITPGIYNGSLTANVIVREIPDYLERTFYISGPRGMVTAFQKSLRQAGVSWWKIKVDFFPGFA